MTLRMTISAHNDMRKPVNDMGMTVNDQDDIEDDYMCSQ